MEEKLFHFIQKTVASITGKQDMVYETDFVKDLGLNSFDIMNIVCAFSSYKREPLLAWALVLFLLCDTVVGLQVVLDRFNAKVIEERMED